MVFTERQLRSIRRYTGSHYRAINEELRGDDSGDQSITVDIFNLDQVLAQSHIARETTVYRGVDEAYVRALTRRGLAAGDVITDKAFLSTSRKPEEARRFMREGNGGMLLRIRLPKGCNALDLSPYSTHPAEREILLPRGTRLLVLGYDDKEDVLDLEVTQSD